MNYQDHLKATSLQLRLSQRERRPYKVRILDHSFIVKPGVFSPRYFRDTEVFARILPIERGDALLEIGTGIGAIAICLALRGAGKIIATDINHKAVRLAKRNVAMHHLDEKIEARAGDLLVPLKDEEREVPQNLLGCSVWLCNQEKSDNLGESRFRLPL
ncbi:MAG: tRNA (adenine(22)-N(1))-methyltransferase TrmK [Candidatus Doudnabacteria bacterium]|nr:tRNA (adenine(22)-N(1))-methyltransferase TrmK [Candidatus Doudnabacteria bacterium]